MYNIILTEVENRVLIAIASILLLIVLGLVIYVIVYNRRLKKNRIEPIKEQRKIINAILLEYSVELMEGMQTDYTFDRDFVPPNTVYTKYYGELVLRDVLMYQYNIGFVLNDPEDDDKKPKFYYLHEVYIAKPGEYMVKGYLNESDEFVITEMIGNK